MAIQITRGTSSTAAAVDVSPSGHSSNTGPSPVSFAQVMADIAVASVNQRPSNNDHDEPNKNSRHHEEEPNQTVALGIAGAPAMPSAEAVSAETGAHASAQAPATNREVGAITSAARVRLNDPTLSTPGDALRPGDLADERMPTTATPSETSPQPDRGVEGPSVQSVLAELTRTTTDASRTLHFITVLNRLAPSASTRTSESGDRTKKSAPTIDERTEHAPNGPSRTGSDATSAAQRLGAADVANASTTVSHTSESPRRSIALGASTPRESSELAGPAPSAPRLANAPSAATGADFVAANGELVGVLARPLAEGDGTYSIRVQIYPPDLGSVNAMVRVRGDAVEVELAPTTAAGRAAIIEHLQGIRDALASGRESVDVRVAPVSGREQSDTGSSANGNGSPRGGDSGPSREGASDPDDGAQRYVVL